MYFIKGRSYPSRNFSSVHPGNFTVVILADTVIRRFENYRLNRKIEKTKRSRMKKLRPAWAIAYKIYRRSALSPKKYIVFAAR